MKFFIAIAFLVLFTAPVAVLWLRKRFAKSGGAIIGERGRTETALEPHGSVIINGQLWPALSVDGRSIASAASVRVVGVDRMDLLVQR
ncbi:MAG TPA: NfeD family protein [Pyrinomonadaceae bacterium]|nr:NfeD family protein [Pyrinomonadaceae bacterium]